MENKVVSIVTIKSTKDLFKGDEKAERIELIELEELGFNLVAGKGLYEVGDNAVYIQPDYNLSDISLFESFIRPGGDESKSMLGKVEGKPRRIRAKKFNFSLEPFGDPVYSNGILLPVFDVRDYLSQKNNTPLGITLDNLLDGMVDLTSELEITKYEEPEVQPKGGANIGYSSKFPEGLYKTDEDNINNKWGHLENKIGYPVVLVGTQKTDGSSITIGIKNNEPIICSRNMSKPLSVRKRVGTKTKLSLLDRIKQFLFNVGLRKKMVDLGIYKIVDNTEDDFVKYGKPLLDELVKNGEDNLILRGELNGSHLKGSGNKYNPAAKKDPNIEIFGLDLVNEYGVAEKASYDELKLFKESYPQFNYVKEVFVKEFNSREEIEKECNEYFKTNLIEGIVIRTLDSKFSVKFMNLEYDSKK